ncbi:glycoprotein antigen BM86-like [Dermacentor variabilis]|uniref:glycoprotein antigen BM86-like n=1 Tax=Dermacentor variabilis TaxID=34621 RepID=UPI003F5C2596
MDEIRGKCVPTTCLYPGISCLHLCNKDLLGKDSRCCQGWDQKDCSKLPLEGTYCSPGSIWNEDEGCIGTTKFILSNFAFQL